MLIYLTAHSWLVGQIPMKSGLITPSTHPTTFTLFSGLTGVLGVLLVGLSPLLLLKIRAPASEQSQFAAVNPNLYGKTRPSLFWAFIALLALFGYALISLERTPRY